MYLDIKDCKEGIRVIDKSWGAGEIKEVLKTRVRVKFDSRSDLVTYDAPHIKICLELEK